MALKKLLPYAFAIFTLNIQAQDSVSAEEVKILQDEINNYRLLAEVGYKHDRSNTKEYIERSGKLKADYNLYPFEFNASFAFKNTLKDNETQQNLNALDISVDRYLRHNLNRTDSTAFHFRPEIFLFFQRATNEYLAIKQKYETGAGFTFNLFSSATVDENIKINKLQHSYRNTSPETQEMLDYLYSSHNAKYRKLRFAFLIGILSQTEELEYETAINVNGTDSAINLSFDPLQEYKWEVRPTFSYRPSKAIKFDARAYFKMPFTELTKPYKGEDYFDYYIEAPISLSYSPGIMSFSFRYTLYYEHIPSSATVRTSVGDKLVSLPNNYSSIDFTVGVQFN